LDPVTSPAEASPDPVYLDHAATTPTLPGVAREMARIQEHCFGNPSSGHGFGVASRKLLDDARAFLTGTLGAAKVVFTSGGSEADLLGVAGAAAARPPGRVLVGAADHPAVLAQGDLLGRLRHRLTVVPTNEYGVPDAERLFDVLGKDVRVVALLHGHNELGSMCPLEDLIESVRRVAPDAHVHVDLVQAYGKVAFDMAELDVDSVAVSAHKLGGPRGVGLLGLRSEARILPLQPAGGQEDGLRGGTENVAGIVGLALAAEHYLLRVGSAAAHTRALGAQLRAALRDAVPDLERLGDPDHRLPHIESLRLPGVQGQLLLERCQARGIAFSIGSACHGSGARNPVHAAIGLSERAAREVVRFSFGPDTRETEVERAAQIVIEEIAALRAQAPRGGSRQARSPRATT